MSGWFGPNRKKSPKIGLVSSGSLEQPSSPKIDLKQGGGQGLHNPLAWDSVPSSLKEKFPHWKERCPMVTQTNSNLGSEGVPSCSLYKSAAGNRQQPKFTLPYVVMDVDTLNSIAIKFETTPADLARLNKKLLANFTIFSGDVLYVPDQYELEQSMSQSTTPATPTSTDIPTVTVTPSTSHPKSAPPSVSHSSSPEHHVGSPDTIRSASIGSPMPEKGFGNGVGPTYGGVTSEGKEGMAKEEKVEFQVFSPPSSPSSIPPSIVDCAKDFEEEVTDTHIMLMSKYISGDQGCIHGNLVVNQTVMMFSPFRDDPIVKEHGPSMFEVVIPLQDVVFAAITTDVAPPPMKSVAPPTVKKEDSTDGMDEEVQNGGVGSEKREESTVPVENGNGCGTIQSGSGQDEASEVGGVDPPTTKGVDMADVGVTSEDVEMDDGEVEMTSDVRSAEEQVEQGQDGQDGQGRHGQGAQVREAMEENQSNGGTVEEAILQQVTEAVNGKMEDEQCDGSSQEESGALQVVKEARNGAVEEEEDEEHLLSASSDTGEASDGLVARVPSSHKISECSVDSLLADRAYFLHIRVSSKSCASYAYIPLNRPVGIDIPAKNPFLPSRQSSIHQVKTAFCFAVAQKRIGDIVHFLYEHRPFEDMPVPPSLGLVSSWVDGSYVILSCEENNDTEELLFSDDHFKGGHSTESWEVFSMQDISKFRNRIDKMEVEHHLPLPVLHADSSVMDERHLRALSNYLPSEAIGHEWVLIYSTFVHGISLRTLYRNMADVDTAVVLLVQDEFKKVFGAVVTCPLKLSEKFKGTGESFLFSFPSSESEETVSEGSAAEGGIEIYHWTGENSYIVKGSPEGLYLGCGDGHTGLWLDEHLQNGTSQACSTFNNACLSTHEEFVCMGLEAWSFLYA